MAISYQAKDELTLKAQLKVQELVVKASSPLCAVAGSDLQLEVGEPLVEVLSVIKQVAAGTLSGVVASITAGSKIVLTGESTAVATTVYIVKYVTK